MSSKLIRNTGGRSQSTSQSSIDAYLARKKREAINRLMEMVEAWLDSDEFTSACSGASGSGTSRSTPCSSQKSSSRGTPQKSSGQKRPYRRDSFDGEDNGGNSGGGGEDKRGSKRHRADANTLRLACPYFKHDPSRFSTKQACTGPGWTSIARLKEHIYRCHRQPHYMCKRCYGEFEDECSLECHQRAEDICKVSRMKPVLGINDDQYEKLRKKSRTTTKTMVERWNEVYSIIYPNAKTFPTPYYDYKDDKALRQQESNTSQIYHTYMEENLVPRIRDSLEESFAQHETSIKENFMDMIKYHLNTLHQNFHKKQPAAAAATSKNQHQQQQPPPPPLPGKRSATAPNEVSQTRPWLTPEPEPSGDGDSGIGSGEYAFDDILINLGDFTANGDSVFGTALGGPDWGVIPTQICNSAYGSGDSPRNSNY
ncbi:hypothetical protein BX600DRAFT_504352 [Xylariales sp. PMI_506]|nr:hypothetical protein BX600DRAFT_504352 [Xylariales sp. PMI_506]